jgi:serine/threonine-protein kinase
MGNHIGIAWVTGARLARSNFDSYRSSWMESESRLLAGKYRLLHPLGRGGMGTVWTAEHLSLRSSVAVKLLEPHIAEDPQSLHRFLNEARAAAALRSPHVVQILDHGVDEGTPFIVMELLEGECLSERLQRTQRLPPAQTARIVTHVARALSRAHEAGIVHRDLKPGNIFLVNNDDEELAKLFDFGIAKTHLQTLSTRAETTTIPGTLVGTPYYMSPEQAQGERADHRADIWALGVIAFECLLGRRPFEADSLGTLILRICSEPMPIPSNYGPVPEGFDSWFARACARDLDQRFSSARDAASEFRTACRVERPSSNSSVLLPVTPPRARRPAWVSLAVLAAFTVGSAALWAFATGRFDPQPAAPQGIVYPAGIAPTLPAPARSTPTAPAPTQVATGAPSSPAIVPSGQRAEPEVQLAEPVSGATKRSLFRSPLPTLVPPRTAPKSASSIRALPSTPAPTPRTAPLPGARGVDLGI